MARAFNQSDLSRGVLSRKVVSSRESSYPSSEDGYMRFFPPAEEKTVKLLNDTHAGATTIRTYCGLLTLPHCFFGKGGRNGGKVGSNWSTVNVRAVS